MHILSQAAETSSSGTNVISAMAVLAALILKASDIVKYVWALIWHQEASKKQAKNSLTTLAVTSAAGVAAAFCFKYTAWAATMKIGDVTFAGLSTFSTIVFGLVATTLAATIYDFKKAVDNTESSSTPRFFKDSEDKRVEQVENMLGGAQQSTPDGPAQR